MIHRYHLILAPEAQEDLAAIHAYIAKDSPDAADRVFSHLASRIDHLKDMPYVHLVYQGRSNPALTIYKMSVNPYVVYNRVSGIDDVG